ncbi:tetratricopeptide repeat protein [Streptomyces sp. NPDC088847]|uniref:tetratricopeptide repeat protein n=1 Tax=Streptomyces sp. NPDC088847 TaxID=3365909 RepID=UPI0038290CCB
MILQYTYTRSDPRGHPPAHRTGLDLDLDLNRLAVFWRPLVDLTDSAYAPVRLRAVPLVSSWLARPQAARRSWFSMIGVPGQRHQVLRHAGLTAYDCADPTTLPPALRSEEWSVLVRTIEAFPDLSLPARALLVFHLAQLSYCGFAIRLCGDVRPTGDPDHDFYAHEVARVNARTPGRTGHALDVFRQLSDVCSDPLLALAACFQGIGHTLRSSGDLELARAFHRRGHHLLPRVATDDWHSNLVRSRFHRAVALLKLAEGDTETMRWHLTMAFAEHDALGAGGTPADALVLRENHRYLIELRLREALRHRPENAPVLGEQVYRLDPYCVDARLMAGDGFAAAGKWREAARRYAHAGELGTAAGAVGWFRAAQCLDAAGDPTEALNAMAHCLELDPTAVEPRTYLTNSVSRRFSLGSQKGERPSA